MIDRRLIGTAIKKTALVAVVVLACLPTPAAAQDTFYGRGGVEINAFGGLFSPGTPSAAPGETPFDLETGALFGGRIIYITSTGISVGGVVGFSPVTLQQQGTDGARTVDLNASIFGGEVAYNFQVSQRAQFFLVVGGGGLNWSGDDLDSELDLDIMFGAGARVLFSPSFGLRFDVRDHYLPNGLSAIRRQLSPGLPLDESRGATNNLEVSAGISIFLGGSKDADGDGIRNTVDACPDTPAGAIVDSRGCPVDSDADGIPDYRDRCPGTAPGARVDETGCPIDTDQDGVPDGIDQCPDTPVGARVNTAGCPVEDEGG